MACLGKGTGAGEGAGAGMERYIYKEKCKTAFIVPREFLALWCGEKAIQLERMVGKLWQYQRRESSGSRIRSHGSIREGSLVVAE
jgi:hypothetical protein